MKLRMILICIATILSSMHLCAQGYRIYGKDGKTYQWNFKDIDSVAVDNSLYKVYKDGKVVQTLSVSKVERFSAFDSSDLDQTTGMAINGHTFVDLGLPSGLLWATCNVEADSPEEAGNYYAWGETEPKSSYTWSTYKWCNGSSKSLTKYTDLNCELENSDDVAFSEWGSPWRMPTKAEVEELLYKCKWQTTTINGVKGKLVTGSNNQSIFLPYSGFLVGTSLENENIGGCVWTRTNGWSVNYNAISLGYVSSSINRGHSSRTNGLPVRPVATK